MDPLPLHRYRLAGQLAEIRASDLAFTVAEAGLLLARHGITLTAGSPPRSRCPLAGRKFPPSRWKPPTASSRLFPPTSAAARRIIAAASRDSASRPYWRQPGGPATTPRRRRR